MKWKALTIERWFAWALCSPTTASGPWLCCSPLNGIHAAIIESSGDLSDIRMKSIYNIPVMNRSTHVFSQYSERTAIAAVIPVMTPPRTSLA